MQAEQLHHLLLVHHSIIYKTQITAYDFNEGKVLTS